MKRQPLLNCHTRQFCKRLMSLLVIFSVILGQLDAVPKGFLRYGHALGGISEYEFDGFEYFVEWDDEEWGEGVCFFHCPTCDQGFGREFSGGDHESCISDMTDEDFFDCGHCFNCLAEYHCAYCGGCFENDVTRCTDCNSKYCEGCHLPAYECSICGGCRLTSDGEHLTGSPVYDAPGLDYVCGDCYDDSEFCVICGNRLWLGGGLYCYFDEIGMEWCESHLICGYCMEDSATLEGYGHCCSCGICEEEREICDECGLCVECAYGDTHCTECDHCFNGAIEMCAEGGEHCVFCCQENDWICPQCEECTEGAEKAICPDCELCEECCLQNSEDEDCIHGYCIQSSDYEDHLCTECGKCPGDDVCEYCGMCEECAADYHCEHEICPDNTAEWEEHLCENCGDCFELDELCDYCKLCEECNEHCKHDICPEGPDAEDHFFCPECDDCFEDEEICKICGKCLECCRNAQLELGCTHEICVASDEFQLHYCFADEQCLSFCSHDECVHEHVSEIWEMNITSHWHTCEDCGGTVDASAHVGAEPEIVRVPNPLTRQNGIAKVVCKDCGLFLRSYPIPFTEIPTDGAPYIISQPKDYTGKVSDVDAESYETTVFSVMAGGGNLSYQWVRIYPPNQKTTVLEDTDDENATYQIKGAKTPTLRINISTDACVSPFGYYCIVTNENGSVQSRTALESAHHTFNEHSAYESYDDGTHARICVGETCNAVEKRSEPHKYGDWFVYKRATENEAGIRRKECAECHHTVDLRIPAVGKNHQHSYTEYHYGKTNHWKECACGLRDSSTVQEHDFADWKVQREATERQAGQKFRRCKVCKYIEYAAIDKLPHTHDFTTVRKNTEFKMAGKTGKRDPNLPPDPYALPNGGFNSEYHYRYCSGCTSRHIEPHTYGSWHILHKPYTGKDGVQHEGVVYRRCTECGQEMQQHYTGTFPILTWVYNPDSTYEYGGATIDGAYAANPGDQVTLTVTCAEGYTIETRYGCQNGWSLNEIRTGEGMRIGKKWYDYQNFNVTDFKTDAHGTATFTMPDGPLALQFMIRKCDHKDCGTYTDHVDPSCTGYGGDVLKCKTCNTIVKEVSREQPTGHRYRFKVWIDHGDCLNQETYVEECLDCKKQRTVRGDYNHTLTTYQEQIDPSCHMPGHEKTFICSVCGTIIDPGPIKAIGSHNWGEWKTLIESTTRTKGIEMHECERCGVSETRKLDYSGPDYRLAVKEKVYFSFEYGDEVKPQTVEIESIGRDEVSDLLPSVSEQYYDVLEQDGLNVTVAPYPTGIVFGGISGQDHILQMLSVKTDEKGDLVSANIQLVSNVTLPKGKFHVALNGAKMSIYNRDLELFEPAEKTAADLPAGTIVRVTADDAEAFRAWLVKDISGMVTEFMGRMYETKDTTIYFAVPPNDVTVTAADSTLHDVNFTVPVPVIGESMSNEFEAYDADGYGSAVKGYVKWTELIDGEFKDVSGVCEADKIYYLHCLVNTEEYSFAKDSNDALLTKITVNGIDPVKPAEPVETYAQAYFAVAPQSSVSGSGLSGRSLSLPFQDKIGGIPVEIIGFEKQSGRSELKLDKDKDNTLTVTIPEGAKPGKYLYAVTMRIGDETVYSAVTVTVDSEAVISFDANGGYGTMPNERAAIGRHYQLPECLFAAPAGCDFGGWEQGQPGDSVLISGDTVLKAKWVLHTHKLKLIPASEPTCTEFGTVEHYACEGCEKTFYDAEGTMEAPTVDFFLIQPTGHTLKPVEAQAASCTKDGHTAYYACESCSAWFEDAEGITPINDHSKTVIEKTGHKWGEAEYSWKDDNSVVTAKRICQHDKTHVETETAAPKKTETAPTCETKGSIVYQAAFENPAFAAQTKTVDIPAAGHSWGDVTYTWSDDFSTVTAKRICKTDSKHTETETVNTVQTVKEPTDSEAGSTTYTAKFVNPAFAQQKKVVEIPMLTTTETTTTTTESVTTTTESVTTTTESSTAAEPAVPEDGDYNGDGSVSTADAVLLARFAAEDAELTEEQRTKLLLAKPDLNGDGIVTLMDVRMLLHALTIPV